MNDETVDGHHWSDTVRNLAIAAVQIASIFMLLEHAGWSLRDHLRELRQRFVRWHRQQVFELYYRSVWPTIPNTSPACTARPQPTPGEMAARCA